MLKLKTSVWSFLKALDKQRHEFQFLSHRTSVVSQHGMIFSCGTWRLLQAIRAVLSYSSRQTNTLHYLNVIRRLLNNEDMVISRNCIVDSDQQSLMDELNGNIRVEDALKQLDCLLNSKGSFKALTAKYIKETAVETPFGMLFANVISCLTFDHCRFTLCSPPWSSRK